MLGTLDDDKKMKKNSSESNFEESGGENFVFIVMVTLWLFVSIVE